MTSLISRGLEIIREESFRDFGSAVIEQMYIGGIRDRLPSVGYHIAHGVIIDDPVKLLDPWLIRDFSITREYEGGIVEAHRKYTQYGADVVAVGGGNGVSLGISSRLSGPEGTNTIYEADPNRARSIHAAVNRNNLNNVNIKNKAVGDLLIDLPEPVPKMSISDLPKCDILELDCEGSEYEIITKLDSLPDAIIVEVHPSLLPVKVEEVLTLLESRGYEIVDFFGHDGINLTEDEFRYLVKEAYSQLNQNQGEFREPLPNDLNILDNGANIPPIVVATLE